MSGMLFSSSRREHNCHCTERIIEKVVEVKVECEKCPIKNMLPRCDNYEVIKYEEINKNVVIMLKYLDATNYEGKKILVYQNTTFKELMIQGDLDPHFLNYPDMKAPIARFVPTDKGWKMAINFVWSLE